MERVLFIYEPEGDKSSSDFFLKKIASFYKEDRYKKDENFVLVNPVEHCGSLGDLKVYQEYINLLNQVDKVVFVLDKSKATLLPLYTAFMKLCSAYNVAHDWITDPRTKEKNNKTYYNRGKCEEIRHGKHTKEDLKKCMKCGQLKTCRREMQEYAASQKAKLAKHVEDDDTYYARIKAEFKDKDLLIDWMRHFNECMDWDEFNFRLNDMFNDYIAKKEAHLGTHDNIDEYGYPKNDYDFKFDWDN